MQIVIGTAGHIDHGKTSLVKALTGTDTDNLIEEKKVWDIPVVDKNKKLVGLLHMHKIVKKFLNI